MTDLKTFLKNLGFTGVKLRKDGKYNATLGDIRYNGLTEPTLLKLGKESTVIDDSITTDVAVMSYDVLKGENNE